MLRFGRINIVQEATKVGDGTMPIVDTGTMRAAWALLANSYARGFSGASPELANTLINRVNNGNVPDDVEWDNSMGDADLTANAQAAMSLLADPKFELKAGEATNLLTHNWQPLVEGQGPPPAPGLLEPPRRGREHCGSSTPAHPVRPRT
jgi:hypothetical protein